MVTTQVVPDSESTCDTAVCVVSFNTNLSNLTNRAVQNLQVGGNSIRVSFNTNLPNLANCAGQNLQVGGNYSGGFSIANCAEKKCTAPCLCEYGVCTH